MNLDRNSRQFKVAVVVGLLLLYWIIHHLTQSKGPTIPIPMVEVKRPVLNETVEYVTQTGTTVAYQSVNLVARVEGYLNKIEFIDGTFIKKNQELFVIQPEPYMDQLKAAQATVAANNAEYAYTKAEYARQKRMYAQNATSLNSVQIWLAKMQAAEANLSKSKADEENAAINYSYTHILAPFDGRIGRHLIDAGNLVGNGAATNLATLEQIDTLYVYFNLNEIDLIKLRSAARKQGMKPSVIKAIPVDIKLQTEDEYTHKATLDFANTGLNASTGTMELRAVLENKDHFFVPGLFVQVRVAITKPEKKLTTPDTAIQYDQIGPYVLTVGDANLVVLKRVVLGSSNQGMRAITQGLSATDAVIVNGLQNATPGNTVAPKNSSTDKASS